MPNLRHSLLQCLTEHSQDEAEFLRHLNRIVEDEGDQTFPVLLKLLTHLDFEDTVAKKKWQEILSHQQRLSSHLGRQVNLLTAVCDFFSSIEKSYNSPKVIEIDELEKTTQFSNIDGLTGLYNRGFFDETLQGEARRSLRYGTSFSLLFFDLDDFKTVNDTLGHPAGDLALKLIADLILREKRSEDIAARYGGEEIVVILPETSKVQALVIAERIRKKVEKLELVYNSVKFHLTVSGGLASFPVDAQEAGEILKRSDQAMYSAKKNGKNNIVLYSSDKREYLRVDFLNAVVAHDLGIIQPTNFYGQGINLSLGGVLFTSSHAFPLGTRLQLQLPLPDGEDPLILIGNVVRLEMIDTEYEIGISFLNVESEVKNEIAQYIVDRLNITSKPPAA